MTSESVKELECLFEVKIYVFYYEGVVLLQGCQLPSEQANLRAGLG